MPGFAQTFKALQKS